MNADKTSLVQKLILFVLVLNLGCLVLLVVRWWPSHPDHMVQAVLQPEIMEGKPVLEPVEILKPRAPAASADRSADVPASPDVVELSEDVPWKEIAPPASLPSQAPGADARTSLVAPPPKPSIAVQARGEKHGGEILGLVTLLGTPPPEIQIQMDTPCARLRPDAAFTRHYVINPEKGLANVFVYLSDGVTGRYAAPAEPVLIDQIDCMFEPYLVGAQTGQRIRIRNSDPVLHNIHATPKPGTGNREFNVAQPIKEQVNLIRFSDAELFVRLKCDVHPWMFAYVCVAEHPFFAVTDADGAFEFPRDVPPGRYTLTARHLKAGSTSHEIRVRPGQRQIVRLQLSVPASGYAER